MEDCPRMDAEFDHVLDVPKPPRLPSLRNISAPPLRKNNRKATPSPTKESRRNEKAPPSPNKENRKSPPSPPKRNTKPPSSPSKRNKVPTAASMLAARLPAPPLSEPEDFRPGASFQRNDNNDARANKVSTFDAENRSSHSTSSDAVAAKIASYDNRPSLPRRNSPPSSHDSFTDSPSSTGSRSDRPTHRVEQPVMYMEISPGQRVRLRGARETWQCVENDFYLPTTCFSCDTDLCCIMDASYVLCPLCKVVSPVEGWAAGPDGGVGLGFTYNDLVQWQHEIMQRRQQIAAGC